MIQDVQQLKEQLRRFERTNGLRHGDGVISTGIPPLDALLPHSGLTTGAVLELLSDEGCGAGALAFNMSAHIIKAGHGALTVVDENDELYAPAAKNLGIDLERMIVVRPGGDGLWALEQCLRCTGVAVTMAWLDETTHTVSRRLQLAAEHGGGIGILLRPMRLVSQTSWAKVRLRITPAGSPGSVTVCLPNREDDLLGLSLNTAFTRRIHAEVLAWHGEGGIDLEIDDETGVVSVVEDVSDSTSAQRAAGA